MLSEQSQHSEQSVGATWTDDEMLQGSSGRHAPHRLFGLSDGVFAISMTLLALDVRIPDGVKSPGFGDAAPEFYAKFGVFVAAFLIAGRFWISSHRIMARLHTVDDGVLERTVMFLVGISALPVAVAVLFRFGSVPAAVTFTSVLLAATTLLSARLWWYLSDPNRGLSDVTPLARRFTLVRLLFITTVYLLAIPIAYLLSVIGSGDEVGWAMAFWMVLVFDYRICRAVLRVWN